MPFSFRLRRGSAAQWTSDNPVLHAGEPGFELDTGKLKIGDGVHAWVDLSYLTSPTQLADVTRGTSQPTESTQGPFYLQIVS